MANILVGKLMAAMALAALPAAVAAQQMSDGYTFLKAVKERDGTTASGLIAEPGSIAINAKDPAGNAALHLLTRERDLVWLGFLLTKGAKANIQDREGNTPLAIAARIGWLEGAERLLRGGARADEPNNRGETPLIMAVHNRDLAMVRLLLAEGADPNHQDSVAGYSALDYARQDRRAASIIKLLESPKKSEAAAITPVP